MQDLTWRRTNYLENGVEKVQNYTGELVNGLKRAGIQDVIMDSDPAEIQMFPGLIQQMSRHV